MFSWCAFIYSAIRTRLKFEMEMAENKIIGMVQNWSDKYKICQKRDKINYE